jgi:hypothetical protein
MADTARADRAWRAVFKPHAIILGKDRARADVRRCRHGRGSNSARGLQLLWRRRQLGSGLSKGFWKNWRNSEELECFLHSAAQRDSS